MIMTAAEAAAQSRQAAAAKKLQHDLEKIQPHLNRAISNGARSVEVAHSAYQDAQATRMHLVGQGYRVTTTHGGYGWLIEW